MTLPEYAAALERSRKPSDRAVAVFMRKHMTRLCGWVVDHSPSKGDMEEAAQVVLLAIVEVLAGPNPDARLNEIHNAVQRWKRHQVAWAGRRVDLNPNEEEG